MGKWPEGKQETIISIIDSAVTTTEGKNRFAGKHGKGNILILSNEDLDDVVVIVPVPNNVGGDSETEVQVVIPKAHLKAYVRDIR